MSRPAQLARRGGPYGMAAAVAARRELVAEVFGRDSQDARLVLAQEDVERMDGACMVVRAAAGHAAAADADGSEAGAVGFGATAHSERTAWQEYVALLSGACIVVRSAADRADSRAVGSGADEAVAAWGEIFTVDAELVGRVGLVWLAGAAVARCWPTPL